MWGFNFVHVSFLKQLTIIFVPVYCGPTPSIPNAVCTASDGVFGDVVTYSCLPGYFDLTESGTGQRTCDSSGTWVTDNTDPVCEESEKENKTESDRERGGKQKRWNIKGNRDPHRPPHRPPHHPKCQTQERRKQNYEAKLKQKQTRKGNTRERQTDRQTETDRQADRQTETDRQTERDRQTDRHRER